MLRRFIRTDTSGEPSIEATFDGVDRFLWPLTGVRELDDGASALPGIA